MRMTITFTLFTFVAGQIVSPILSGLVNDLIQSGGSYTLHMLVEYWLRLSIANTYLWLLMFYFYFHLYLNLTSELLRFGDRIFYKDWWNSSEISTFWRLWNRKCHSSIEIIVFTCIYKYIYICVCLRKKAFLCLPTIWFFIIENRPFSNLILCFFFC